MAVFQCEIYSEELKKNASFIVVQPDISFGSSRDDTMKNYPVICLLHETNQDHQAWLRQLPLEQISNQRHQIFVLPDGEGSGFKNIDGIGNYESYILQELPQILHRYFGFSTTMEVCYGIDSL